MINLGPMLGALSHLSQSAAHGMGAGLTRGMELHAQQQRFQQQLQQRLAHDAAMRQLAGERNQLLGDRLGYDWDRLREQANYRNALLDINRAKASAATARANQAQARTLQQDLARQEKASLDRDKLAETKRQHDLHATAAKEKNRTSLSVSTARHGRTAAQEGKDVALTEKYKAETKAREDLDRAGQALLADPLNKQKQADYLIRLNNLNRFSLDANLATQKALAPERPGFFEGIGNFFSGKEKAAEPPAPSPAQPKTPAKAPTKSLPTAKPTAKDVEWAAEMYRAALKTKSDLQALSQDDSLTPGQRAALLDLMRKQRYGAQH